MARTKKAIIELRKQNSKFLSDQMRARVFLDLISILYYHDLKEIAKEAEVSNQTLHNWLYGATMNPHINTLIKVANVLGYEIALRKKQSTGLRRVK